MPISGNFGYALIKNQAIEAVILQPQLPEQKLLNF
jgi:hypothetical protein